MLIKREKYLSRIRPFYEVDLIKVLVGVRRCGKSKMLELIMNELRASGIDQEHIIYLSFEDIGNSKLLDSKTLNEYIVGRVTDGRYYIFLDEIQEVNGFEKAINSFRATLDCSVFVTGSNSKLLSGELATLLTGRVVEFQINPFSYDEAVEYLNTNDRTIPSNFIANYMNLGGFPLRLSIRDENAAKLYIEQLYSMILAKDIFKRSSEMEKEKFMKVAEYVLANAGRDISAKRIADYMCSANGNSGYISTQTIYSYLEKMEKAFLIRGVSQYQFSGEKILSAKKKYYAIDPGLISIVCNSDMRDIGTLLENIVFNELISRGFEVYIGKTYKGEVDFVAMHNGKKCFIQVAYLMPTLDTVEREFGAFVPIHNAAPKYVISMDPVNMSQNGITHLNLIDFLTDQSKMTMS